MSQIFDKVKISLTLQGLDGKPVPLLVGRGVETGENIREPIELSIEQIRTVVLIPSTSIKGVLRSIAYSLMKQLARTGIFNGLAKYSALLHEETMEKRTWHIDGIEDKLKRLYGDKYKDILSGELLEQLQANTRNQDILRIAYSSLGRDVVVVRREHGRIIFELSNDMKNYVEEGNLKKCFEISSCMRFVDLIFSYYCPLDRLFGSQYFKGKMNIKSALLSEDKYMKMPRTHVAINRNKQVKEEKALYIDRIIYVKELNIELTIYDLEENSPEEKLLNSLLDYIKNVGIQLGGGKSIGYGYMILADRKIEKINYEKLHQQYIQGNIDEIIEKIM